jgi:hypothetical protein
VRREVHRQEAHGDAQPNRCRVRRGEPVAARDEDEQERERDPAGDAGNVDLAREGAPLACVVERVQDVRGDEQQGGAAERGAGQRAHC